MKVCILILLAGVAIARDVPVPTSFKVTMFGRFCSMFWIDIEAIY
jgi:hypothetical protein